LAGSSRPRGGAGVARRVDQKRSEAAHPPEHAHMVDLDPAFGQQLLDIAEGKP